MGAIVVKQYLESEVFEEKYTQRIRTSKKKVTSHAVTLAGSDFHSAVTYYSSG